MSVLRRGRVPVKRAGGAVRGTPSKPAGQGPFEAVHAPALQRVRRGPGAPPMPGIERERGTQGRGRGRAAADITPSDRSGAKRLVKGPQRERHEPDYLILVAIIALAAIGILMVYSSSGVRAYLFDEDPFAEVGPQLLWGGLGVITMFLTMRMDYRFLRLISVPFFAVTIVLLVLVLIPEFGTTKGGSARWLKIGPLPEMHPAEFAKLALVIYLAHWLAKRGFQSASLLGGTIPFLIIAGPVILLVALEPDLGTTGVITLTAATIFFVSGASLWQMALMGPTAMAFVVWVISRNPYQMARLEAFLDPWRDAQGIGFHTVQGLLALALGGLFGSGLGESRQPGALHLPNAANDFVFAVVGQEFGLVGGFIVIALFLLVAYRGVRVALGAPDTFGALLATGITAWLTIQAFINIGVVVSLIPITGITLPFVSSGGSSLLVSFAAVGVLLSISRETLPRGTWNDADPDRGRRHRRPHLSGFGRRRLPAGTSP